MARMLEDLLNDTRHHGWAAGEGTIEQVKLDAAALKWTEVPTCRGGPAVTTLRPVDSTEAAPIPSAHNMEKVPSRCIRMMLICLTRRTSSSFPASLQALPQHVCGPGNATPASWEDYQILSSTEFS